MLSLNVTDPLSHMNSIYNVATILAFIKKSMYMFSISLVMKLVMPITIDVMIANGAISYNACNGVSPISLHTKYCQTNSQAMLIQT